MRLTTLALLLVTLMGCDRLEADELPPHAADAPSLRVATYNVNYGLAGDPDVLAAILATDADIIALQETTPAWERAIRAALSEDYPHILFHHEPRGAGGLALLSRHPVEVLDTLPGLDGWFPAWRALARTPAGDVQLLALHLRPPVSDTGNFISGYFLAPSIHTDEIAAFTAELDPDLPTVALGDFNESPTGAAIGLLEARGFFNALPAFAPGAITWRWPTRFGELRNTFDHVLVSHAHFHVEDARVLDAGRSDHLPVTALLRWR